MDVLSEFVADMRIADAMFTRLDATAPWGFASQGDPVIKFVLVVRGAGILTTASHPDPIHLSGGDVFIMLGDEPYRMFDHETSQRIDCLEIEKARVGHRVEVGGGGALTTFISGFFRMNAVETSPVAAVLPPLLHLRLDRHRSARFQSVLELLAIETEDPGLGSDAAIGKLFELLFIHSVRAYAAQPDGPARGWLAAMPDHKLSRAIDAMHADPAQGWTVEALAGVSGMSRSAFAARFKAVVGETPVEYLTRYRVHRARRLMRQRGSSLADVAGEVGYESVAAFNRAFKKEVRVTPGRYRSELAQRA